MNHRHFSMRMAVRAVSIFVAICSTTADAKGYGTHRSTATSEQEISRRLTQMEEQQRAMKESTASEFKKLRAELDSLKSQAAAKIDVTAGK